MMARFTYYVSADRRDAYLTGGEQWCRAPGGWGRLRRRLPRPS